MIDAEEERSDGEPVQYSARSNESPIGAPAGWYYCGYVDLAENNSYTEGCYISTGDYDSVIYYTGTIPQTQKYIAKISTKQVFTNTYNAEIYLHTKYENKWQTPESVTLSFSIFSSSKILLTGTTSQLYDGFALRFLQSSTGETPFYYTVSVSL